MNQLVRPRASDALLLDFIVGNVSVVWFTVRTDVTTNGFGHMLVVRNVVYLMR